MILTPSWSYRLKISCPLGLTTMTLETVVYIYDLKERVAKKVKATSLSAKLTKFLPMIWFRTDVCAAYLGGVPTIADMASLVSAIPLCFSVVIAPFWKEALSKDGLVDLTK